MSTRPGYISLLVVIVLAAVVVGVVTTTPLLGISESRFSLARRQAEQARAFVEGCVADAVLRINEADSLPATITLPEGTCSVTIHSQSGTGWNFSVSGTLHGIPVTLEITADRQDPFGVSEWQIN